MLLTFFTFILVFSILKKWKNNDKLQKVKGQKVSFISQESKQLLNLLQKLTRIQKYQKDSVTLYSIYKYLLYLEAKMYVGTNLATIFTVLNKVSQQEQKEKIKLNFEKYTLKNIKQQIIEKNSHLLISGKNSLRIMEAKTFKVKIVLNQIQNQLSLYLEDLLNYNVSLRHKLGNLHEKLQQIKLFYQNLNEQNFEHKTFIQMLKECILISFQIQEFVLNMLKSYVLFQQKENTQFLQKFLQKKDKERQSIVELIERVQFTLTQICRQDNSQSQISTKPNSVSLISSQLHSIINHQLNNLITSSKIKQIQQINLDALNNLKLMQSQQYSANPQILKDKYLENLNLEIMKLTQYGQEVKKVRQIVKKQTQKKHGRYKLTNRHNENYEEQKSQLDYSETSQIIKIYEQSIPQSQLLQITQPSFSNPSNNPSLQIFSPQKRSLFIKQLDRLMIRNQLHKQIEQKQRKLKQQQQKQKQAENDQNFISKQKQNQRQKPTQNMQD